jgi:hypothetical protein
MTTLLITGTNIAMMQISDGTSSHTFDGNGIDISYSPGPKVNDFFIRTNNNFKLNVNEVETLLECPIGSKFVNNSQITLLCGFWDDIGRNYFGINLKPAECVVYNGGDIPNLSDIPWFTYIPVEEPEPTPPPKPPSGKRCVCFTKNTLDKILPLIKKDHIVIESKRDQSLDIIRATHKDLGIIEFTENHPFIHKGKKVNFKNLVKINKNFTDVEIVNDTIDEVYNIASKINVFQLSKDLRMLGAKYISKEKEWSCEDYSLRKKLENKFSKLKYQLQK